MERYPFRDFEPRRPIGYDEPRLERRPVGFDEPRLPERRPVGYDEPRLPERRLMGLDEPRLPERRPVGFDEPRIERRPVGFDEPRIERRPVGFDEPRIERRPMGLDEARGYEREGIEVVGLADEGDYNLLKRRERISELRRDIPRLREMPKYREEGEIRREIPRYGEKVVVEREVERGERTRECGEDLNVCYLKTPTETVLRRLMPDNSLVTLDKRLNYLSSSGVHGSIFYSYLIQKEGELVKKFKVALKFAKNKASDNLFYEYLVGLCVNKLRDMYPTFTRTLFISRINGGSEFREKLERKRNFELDYSEMEQLKNNIPSGEEVVSMKNLGDFCSNSENAVLMTEYIGNIGSITKFLNNPIVTYRDKLVNFVNIMFQVYYTLYGVREIFVHNDLHRDNVILHKAKENYGYAVVLPEEGIRVRDEVIKFKNKRLVGDFIPVIIDYGRSYIDCDKVENSKRGDLTTMNIARVMCKTPECKGLKSDRCGYGLGYNAISRGKGDEPVETKFEEGDLAYGFKMLSPNQSQDLRYFISCMDVLETLLEKLKKEGLKESPTQLFIIKYLIFLNDSIDKPPSSFFFPEKKQPGVTLERLERLQYKEEIKINNITDLFIGLCYLINSNEYQNLQQLK
jgi:hypothetical protein